MNSRARRQKPGKASVGRRAGIGPLRCRSGVLMPATESNAGVPNAAARGGLYLRCYLMLTVTGPTERHRATAGTRRSDVRVRA